MLGKENLTSPLFTAIEGTTDAQKLHYSAGTNEMMALVHYQMSMNSLMQVPYTAKQYSTVKRLFITIDTAFNIDNHEVTLLSDLLNVDSYFDGPAYACQVYNVAEDLDNGDISQEIIQEILLSALALCLKTIDTEYVFADKQLSLIYILLSKVKDNKKLLANYRQSVIARLKDNFSGENVDECFADLEKTLLKYAKLANTTDVVEVAKRSLHWDYTLE